MIPKPPRVRLSLDVLADFKKQILMHARELKVWSITATLAAAVERSRWLHRMEKKGLIKRRDYPE